MNVQYSKRIRLLANLLVSIQFLSLSLIMLLAVLDFTTAYWYLNLALMSLATYLIFSAYKSLKPSLRINPIPKEGAEFIRGGIYRRVRHPMYAAVILFGFGASGFSNNQAAVVICGILIVGIAVKAKLEDRLLLQRHPEIWEYQMSTPGFIPCRCQRPDEEIHEKN